jgi:hypothetical protein
VNPRATRSLCTSLLLWLLLPAVAVAEVRQEPIVRAELEPRRVVVGQSAVLRVTVLVPTWFPKPVAYPAFQVPNLLTRLPADSSYPTNEDIEGELWSGIVREYLLYPIHAGRFRLEDQSLTVTWQDPVAQAPLRKELVLETIELDGYVPAGAESLSPFLSGRSLEIEEHLEGDLEALEPGSAVKRIVIARIDGMAAMFLPEMLRAESGDGRSDYAGLATVRDEGTIGERVETIAYVFERGGSFAVEPLRLAYWSTETDRIELAELPGHEFDVGGGLPLPDVAYRHPLSFWLGSLALALGLARVLRGWPAAALARWRALAESIRSSERYAFLVLTRTVRREPATEVARALIRWDEHPALGPASRPPASVQALRSAAFGGPGEPDLDGAARRRLLAELRTQRRARLSAMRPHGESASAPLNP